MVKRVDDESEISDNEYSDENDNLNDTHISNSSDKSEHNEAYENRDEKDLEEKDQNGDFKKITMEGHGKNWLYFAHVKNEYHLKQICQENYLEKRRICLHKQVIFTCYRSTMTYRRKHPAYYYCPIRALYIPEKKSLYMKGRHDHPIDKEMVKTNSKKACSLSNNAVPDKSALVCSEGRFPYFAHVENHGHLLEICRQNGLAKSVQCNRKCTTNTYSDKRNVNFISCKRSSSITSKVRQNGCPIEGIYVPSKHALYLRNGHSHPLEAKDTADENIVGNNYVDKKGRHWPLLRQVCDDQDLAKICKEHWLNIQKDLLTYNYYRCKHFSRLNEWPNELNKYCPYRTIFYKPNSSMYYMYAHAHPLVEKKNVPEKVGEPYIDKFGKVWRYLTQFRKNISLPALKDICRRKHKLGNGKVEKNKIYFNSRRQCEYQGILLRENNCLYVRKRIRHNHKKNTDKKEANKANADHVDQMGRAYTFLANIKHEKHLKDVCQKNWLIKFKETSPNGNVYLKCLTSTRLNRALYRRKGMAPVYCQIKGIYVASKCALYVSKEGHNHELANNDDDQIDEAEKKEGSDGVEEDDSDLDEDVESVYEEESNDEEVIDSHDDVEENEVEESEDEVDDDGKLLTDEEQEMEVDDLDENEDYEVEEEMKGEKLQNDELNEEDNNENTKSEDEEQEEKPRKDAVQTMENVEDVQIVRAIIRDYKWLPGIKREGEVLQKDWPIVTIEDPRYCGHGKVPTKKAANFFQKVKKELPALAGVPPNPMLPSTSGAAAAAPKYWWQQQAPAEPARRLLRERKGRINYAD